MNTSCKSCHRAVSTSRCYGCYEFYCDKCLEYSYEKRYYSCPCCVRPKPESGMKAALEKANKMDVWPGTGAGAKIKNCWMCKKQTKVTGSMCYGSGCVNILCEECTNKSDSRICPECDDYISGPSAQIYPDYCDWCHIDVGATAAQKCSNNSCSATICQSCNINGYTSCRKHIQEIDKCIKCNGKLAGDSIVCMSSHCSNELCKECGRKNNYCPEHEKVGPGPDSVTVLCRICTKYWRISPPAPASGAATCDDCRHLLYSENDQLKPEPIYSDSESDEKEIPCEFCHMNFWTYEGGPKLCGECRWENMSSQTQAPPLMPGPEFGPGIDYNNYLGEKGKMSSQPRCNICGLLLVGQPNVSCLGPNCGAKICGYCMEKTSYCNDHVALNTKVVCTHCSGPVQLGPDIIKCEEFGCQRFICDNCGQFHQVCADHESRAVICGFCAIEMLSDEDYDQCAEPGCKVLICTGCLRKDRNYCHEHFTESLSNSIHNMSFGPKKYYEGDSDDMTY